MPEITDRSKGREGGGTGRERERALLPMSSIKQIQNKGVIEAQGRTDR